MILHNLLLQLQDRKVWVPSDGRYTTDHQTPKEQIVSDDAILSTTDKETIWPSGSEFLGSIWAFTMSLHSIWSPSLSDTAWRCHLPPDIHNHLIHTRCSSAAAGDVPWPILRTGSCSAL